MNKRQFCLTLYVLFVLLITTSCEWDGSDDENYVEIEKPSGIHVAIDLAGVNSGELIQIAPNSNFFYTVNSGSHALIEQKYYLDGVELTNKGWYSSAYYVNVGDGEADGKIHELKLVMALKTNSGSLAEMARAEFYVGEYNFRLKFTPANNSVGLQITQSLDENSYLKLNWVKPENIDFERYEVYSIAGNGEPILLKTINDPSETFFVDHDYNYGYKRYTIKAIPKNSINVQAIEQEWYAQYKNLNSDHVSTKLSPDFLSIEIKNPNAFPSKYVINFYENQYQLEAGETRINIPRPYFPYHSTFITSDVYILPANADYDDWDKYSYSKFHFSDKYISENPCGGQILDYPSKTLYSFGGQNFYKYRPENDLKLLESGKLPGEITVYPSLSDATYSSTKSGTIAVCGYQSSLVYLFRNFDLSKRSKAFDLAPNRIGVSDSHLFYTKDKILYAFNLDSETIDDQKAFSVDYSAEALLRTSSDGKYIILYSPSIGRSWYTIYEFRDNKFYEIKHENTMVRIIVFNPEDESQIFFHDYDNQFYIMDVATQTISKTIAGYKYLSSDPYTGNVLCYDPKTRFLCVFDKTFSKSLYQTVFSGNFPHVNEIILVNNILYNPQGSRGSFYLDLSEQIGHN